MMSLLCLTKEVAFYPADNEKPTRTFKQESCQIRLGELCVYRAALTAYGGWVGEAGGGSREVKEKVLQQLRAGIEGAAGQEAKDL